MKKQKITVELSFTLLEEIPLTAVQQDMERNANSICTYILGGLPGEMAIEKLKSELIPE